MNTQQSLKTGQIWTNAHRSDDGKKTRTGGCVTYHRLDEIIVSYSEGRTEACVNMTDVNDGTQIQIDIEDLFSNKTLFVDVK